MQQISKGAAAAAGAEERAVSKINVHMKFEESQRIRGGPNAKCTYLPTPMRARSICVRPNLCLC